MPELPTHSSLDSTPLSTVTVAIPAYNESEHIEAVIQTFLTNTYPQIIEILVADGGSTDRTQTIVQHLAAVDPRVKLLDNPQKLQVFALNQMIAASQGQVFLRADAHCLYANDYVEQCVLALKESGAANVGGAQRFVAQTPFQAGVALAARSLLGSGGAAYRNPEFNGYADTVFMGCFWKEKLVALSGYVTDFHTNEDAELNTRLNHTYTKGIYVSSGIKVWYFPRDTWRKLCLQYFRYGRGRYCTFRQHSTQLPLRSLLPALMVLVLSIYSLIDLIGFAGSLKSVWVMDCLVLLPFLEAIRVTAKTADLFATEIWRGDPQSLPSYFARVFIRVLLC